MVEVSPPRKIVREYPGQPVVAVGAVVVKDGRVLMITRAQPPRQGLWSIPGGVVELGEALREAAAREVREETGVEAEMGEVLTVVDRILQDEAGRVQYHYVIVDFAARWLSGEAKASSDAASVYWLEPGEIEDPVFADLARKALAQHRE
jgi:8-oxo-dGTP diphosphatase